MKPIKLILFFLIVLIIASCGQSRFTKKKYLNLKAIDSQNKIELIDQNVSEDKIQFPLAQVDSVTNPVHTIPLDFPMSDDKSELDKSTSQIKEWEKPLSTIIPDFEFVKKTADLPIEIDENKKEDRPADKMNEDFVLSIVIMVVYAILCTFLALLELFSFGLWVVIPVISVFFIALVILGIITIRKGKKRLKKKNKDVSDWILGILVLVAGIFGIVGGAVGVFLGLLIGTGLA